MAEEINTIPSDGFNCNIIVETFKDGHFFCFIKDDRRKPDLIGLTKEQTEILYNILKPIFDK